MRLAVFAALVLAASAAQAAELPIKGSYCSDAIRLSAKAVEYEDGACKISRVVASAGEWAVAADCGEADEQAFKLKISPDKKTASVTYDSDTEAVILTACP